MKSTLLKIVCLSSLIIQCGEKEQPSNTKRYFKKFEDLVKNLPPEILTELMKENLLNEQLFGEFKTPKGYFTEPIISMVKDKKSFINFIQTNNDRITTNSYNVPIIEHIIKVCKNYNVIKEEDKETKNADNIKLYLYNAFFGKYYDETVLFTYYNQLRNLQDPDLKKGDQVISIMQSFLNTIIENVKKNIWDTVMKQTYLHRSIPPVNLDKIQIYTSGTKIDINGNIKEYKTPVLNYFDFQYKDEDEIREVKLEYVTTKITDATDLVLQIEEVINQIKQDEENNNLDKRLQEKLKEYEFAINKGQKTIDDLKNEINKVRENTNKILDLKNKDEFKNLGSQVDDAAKQYFNRYKSEIMSTFDKVTGVNDIIVDIYKGLDIFNLPDEVKFNNKTVIEVFNECFNNELAQYFDNTKGNEFTITLTKTLDINDAKIDNFKIVTGFENIEKGNEYKCVTNKASGGFNFKIDEILLNKLTTFICSNVENELINLFKDATKYSNCQNDNRITKRDQLNKFFNDKFTYDNIPGNESKTEKLDELLSIKITDYIKDSGDNGLITLFTNCSKNVISKAFGNSSDFKDFLSKLEYISKVSVKGTGAETIVTTLKGLAEMDASNLDNWKYFNALCQKICEMKEAMKKVLLSIVSENSPFKDFLEKYLIGRIGYNFVDQDFVDITKLDDSSLASKIKKNTLLCYNSIYGSTDNFSYGTLLHKWIFVDSAKWNTDKNDDRLSEIVKTNEKLAEFIFCNDRQFATRDGGTNTYKTDKIANLNQYFKSTNVSFTDENHLKINTIFVFSKDGKYVYEDCNLSKLIKIEEVYSDNKCFIAEEGDHFCKERGNIDMNHILALFGDWTGGYSVIRFCQCDHYNDKIPSDGKEKGKGNYVCFNNVISDVDCADVHGNNADHFYLII